MAAGRKWGSGFAVDDIQVNASGVHDWPFNAEFPVDVIYHLLSGNQPFRMNRHDYFELVYVQSGEIVWQVQNRLLHEKSGQLFVVGSGLYHRVTEYSRPLVRTVSLFFLPEVIRGSSSSSDCSQYLAPFYLQDSSFPHVIPARTGIPRQVVDLFGRIYEELSSESEHSRLYIKTYLKMVLVLLNKHYASYQGTKGAFDSRERALQRLRPLFEFVENRYGEPLGAGDVACLVGMKRKRFARFFKHVTGQSFTAYLNHFRIAKAQVFLAETEAPIAEVSQDVGFCDQSYFGFLFRKLTATTPAQYRRATCPGATDESGPSLNLLVLPPAHSQTSSLRAPQPRSGRTRAAQNRVVKNSRPGIQYAGRARLHEVTNQAPAVPASLRMQSK
jgi:AraC-like DNA-binding protein